jgi:hypothetical protein
MSCECGGTCVEPDGLNLEGVGIWMDIALHRMNELKVVNDLNKLKEGLLFLGNALQNVNFLLGRENFVQEDRRTGN